jgi:hypothetical protein
MNEPKDLRNHFKENGKAIASFLETNYLKRNIVTGEKKDGVCLFCHSNQHITKEHVLPKWAFQKKSDKFFITNINGLSHTYNQTTLPACLNCNSKILNYFEKEINRLFNKFKQVGFFFSGGELEDLIRWFEILDYKFQVFSIITKFHALKNTGNIPYLTDFSLSVLDSQMDYSASKVLSTLRISIKRITKKSKISSINSLVIFKTTNQGMHFWHKNNDYLFLELPQKGVALFYFYERQFSTIEEAHATAVDIIREQY